MYAFYPKQQFAYDRIKAGANVFISGPGGVGKSVLINRVREEMGDETVFLAPTGIAAINIKGATVHRVFRFPLGYLSKYARNNVAEKAEAVFEKSAGVKRIVIDEISMTRADLFCAIDQNLRRIRKVNRPFGGLQVVVVGDFYQLPPVLNKNSAEGREFSKEFSSEFAFDTDSWKEANFETIELDKIMRQSDEEFIGALNSIRVKDKNYARSLNFLNQRAVGNEEVCEEAIFLCSTNKAADIINESQFEELEGEPRTYVGRITGSFKVALVPETITLKVGCKVLVCANSDAYTNGQVGYVMSMHDAVIMVELQTGEIVAVKEHVWEEYDYETSGGGAKPKVVGTFKQFPLKLGYAITVHKSQGLSLDSAIIYNGNGFFAPGQAYVGLSRLRTLGGMGMLKPLDLSDVIVDKRVHQFYEDNRYSNLLNGD